MSFSTTATMPRLHRRRNAFSVPTRSSSLPTHLSRCHSAHREPTPLFFPSPTDMTSRPILETTPSFLDDFETWDLDSPDSSSSSVMSSCTYCAWLDTWPETDPTSRASSPSASLSAASEASEEGEDEYSISPHTRRGNPQNEDTRRHGLVLPVNSNYDLAYDSSCPDFESLVAWRGPPPPYEEEELAMHPLVYLQPRSEDVFGRKRSRCSSLTVQMANLVRVDSVVSAKEAVVKSMGEVVKRALEFPEAVKGAKKALDARRAKRKIEWLGKRQYL